LVHTQQLPPLLLLLLLLHACLLFTLPTHGQ
jgi:hypothetical protein